jgi:hypothetical protein
MSCAASPLRFPLLLIALVGGSVSAQANTISYWVDIFSGDPASLTPLIVPTEVAAGTAPVTISVPQFNEGKGTLTAVNFTLVTAMTATATVTNTDSTASHTFDGLKASMPLTVSELPSGVSLSTTATAGPVAGSVAKATLSVLPLGSFAGFLTAGECVTLGGKVVGANCDFTTNTTASFLGTTVTSSTSASGAPLSLYESFAPAGLKYQTTNLTINVTGNETSGNGKLQFAGSGTGGGILEVDYVFTPAAVPEPTTMILIGSSMFGLGLLLRKKARKS